MMVAQVCGLEAHEFIHTSGDAHLYLNHLEQAKLQLLREPRRLPRMLFRGQPHSILEYGYEDFVLEDYDPHPHIGASISV